MIDFHTHLLPQIDDGACDVATALQMTEALSSQNVTEAVCTPHFDPSSSSVEEFTIKRSVALSKMVSSPIRLIPGSETLLHEYLFYFNDLSALCIGNTRYLLLELPYQKRLDRKIYDHVSRLTNYYNIIPIIAHVERYRGIRSKQMKALVQMGCILQLNTSSILNKRTRDKALRYIKKGYIHIIGTDCHDMLHRPPNMSPALDVIEEQLGASFCEKLEYYSLCIINGLEHQKNKSYIIE